MTEKVLSRPAKKKTPQKSVPKTQELSENIVSPEERLEMIAEAAYYRAEQRGFDPYDQVKDWLEAEKIVDEMLDKNIKGNA